MASQRMTFGSTLGLTVVGLAIMLYGVSLNNGAGPNAPIAAGGAVILSAFAILAAGVITLDEHAETA
jgi:hypothetical protein